jgi:hypothetical protein
VPYTEAKINDNDNTPIRYEGFIADPPIDMETWNLAQERISGQRIVASQRRETSGAYPLSGLLRCVACGESFFGFTSTKSEKTRRRYYRHSTRMQKGKSPCQWRHSYIRAEEVEPPTFDVIHSLLKDDRLIELWNEQATLQAESDDVPRLEQELAETKANIESTEHAMTDGAMMMMRASTEAQRLAFEKGLQKLDGSLELFRNRASTLGEELRSLVQARQMGDGLRVTTHDLRTALETSDAISRYRTLSTLIPAIEVSMETGTVDLCVGTL